MAKKKVSQAARRCGSVRASQPKKKKRKLTKPWSSQNKKRK